MCGIAGIVNWKGADSVEKMTHMLRHRGPDDAGFYSDEYAALGHRRLSIIDLSPAGRQPMANEAEDLHLVFNGEIYDYEALRSRLAGHTFRSHSDSELLLHLYEEKGEDLVHEISGMFAFAIWDRKRKRLLLARDPMGKKPLYYRLQNDGIAFASELKAFGGGEVSREALHAYLVLGYVPGELSIFEGVRKLLPGSVAVFDESGFRSRRYFIAGAKSGSWEKDASEYERELAEKLREAVRRRLVADVEVGLFLSGGIDSSLLAALVAERQKIRTFSIGFTSAAFDESSHALRVSKILGTEHVAHVVGPKELIGAVSEVARIFDEPFADASAAPTCLLAKMTAEHVKVALSGDGADELFGGYPTLRAQAWADRLSAVSGLGPFMRRGIDRVGEGGGYYPAGYVLKRFTESFGRSAWRRQLHWTSYVSPDVISTVLPGAEGFPAVIEEIGSSCESASSSETSRTLDQRLYLPDNILVKTDRATMGYSLEARAPFLDRELVDFANRLPNPLVSGKVLLKRILRKTPVGFAAARPKRGFAVPVSSWLRGDLKDWARQRIEAAPKFGLDARGIDILWKEHQEKKRDRWREIWAIVMLMEWSERWRQ